MKKRIFCAALCLFLLLSIFPAVRAAGTLTAGGWNETIWAVIDGLDESQVTAVSYSGTTAAGASHSGQLTGHDLTYLVRNSGGDTRIDIPGVPAGTYTLTVSTASGKLTQAGITVAAQDRSGYAHWNYTEGVGAYNDDGTLKDNAVVLYVTEENKNTVTLTAGGITVTGIGNILNTSGKANSSGTTGSGGKANTNGDILRKLAKEGKALVVRIIGTVTAPEGLTAWGSKDYGGSTDDNGSMAILSGCRNITVEGIGTDAVVNGWGFSVRSASGDTDAGLGKNFEFRNLTFVNVPEDCIGLSGTQSDGVLTNPIQRCWVHNCAFYGPTGIKDASEDQDKDQGDGACDFKQGMYFTLSYCYFDSYHKTSLIGGGDSHLQYHITWHHNYWKDCESRVPLGRQADLHMYNNVVEGQSSKCMDMRAKLYIYSEYNLYLNSKKVATSDGTGICKSYNDTFTNCTGTDSSYLVTVSSRSTKVSSSNPYAGFETDASLCYIASGAYALQTDSSTLYSAVTSQAGPQKLSAGDPDFDSADAQTHNFTTDGLTSSFYSFSSCNTSTGKGTVTYNGMTLTTCLKTEAATQITFTAPSDGQLLLVFGETGLNGIEAAGQTVQINGTAYTLTGSILTVPISAGQNTVTKGSAQLFLYYMAYTAQTQAHTHSYNAQAKAATCVEAGSITYTCACGDSYTDTIAATGIHSFGAWSEGVRSCTVCGYTETEAGESTQPTDPEPSESVPSGSESTEPSSTPTEPAATDGSEPTGSTETSAEATQPASQTQPSASEDGTSSNPQPEENSGGAGWIVAIILLLLAAAAAILIFFRKKNKK